MVEIIISYNENAEGEMERQVQMRQSTGTGPSQAGLTEEAVGNLNELTYAVPHMAFVKATMDEVAQRVESADMAWLETQVQRAEQNAKDRENA